MTNFDRAKVRAETLREAADWLRGELDAPWGDRAANRLDVLASRIQREVRRGSPDSHEWLGMSR